MALFFPAGHNWITFLPSYLHQHRLWSVAVNCQFAASALRFASHLCWEERLRARANLISNVITSPGHFNHFPHLLLIGRWHSSTAVLRLLLLLFYAGSIVKVNCNGVLFSPTLVQFFPYFSVVLLPASIYLLTNQQLITGLFTGSLPEDNVGDRRSLMHCN